MLAPVHTNILLHERIIEKLLCFFWHCKNIQSNRNDDMIQQK